MSGELESILKYQEEVDAKVRGMAGWEPLEYWRSLKIGSYNTEQKRAIAAAIEYETAKARREAFEACARMAEGMKITGGFVIGPLFNAGWDECCQVTAAAIRAQNH